MGENMTDEQYLTIMQSLTDILRPLYPHQRHRIIKTLLAFYEESYADER